MKFEMMKKPICPKREKTYIKERLGRFSNLQKIIKYYEEKKVDFNDVKVIIDNYNYYEDDVYLGYEIYETDEDYNRRLKIYDKQLEKYNKWFKKYEKEIKMFKKEKAAEEKERLLKEQERIQGLMDKLNELNKEDKKFNLGWYINPFIIGDIVEFTEEVKKEYSFPGGIFTICRIDLDPKNWISCHPITIWLTLIDPKQSIINVGSYNIDGNTIVVNCSRKGTRMSNDLQKETVMFKKVEKEDECE